MTTVVRREKGYRIYTKGSFEVVLPRCTNCMSLNGQEKPLNMSWKQDIEEYVRIMLKNGRKVLAMAYKNLTELPLDIENLDENELDKILNSELTMIGILGIEDKVRADAAESVRKCKKAGIAVRMISGEHTDLAKNFAKSCNIVSEIEIKSGLPGLIIEGPELEEITGGLITRYDENNMPVKRLKNEQKFLEIMPNIKVLSRASAYHKLLLVTGLLGDPNNENTVAITGHDAMDKQVLQKADIGFAMGIKGSDVAREAADVIITNDNYTSILAGIKWGRNIYYSIRKLVQFQITANMVAILIACLGGIILGESPMNALHLLWVNLVVDILASFSVPSDPPSDNILEDKPVKSAKPLVSPTMWRYIIVLGIYQLSALIFIMMFGELLFGFGNKITLGEKWNQTNTELNTIIFNTYIYMQIANFICCRKIKSQGIFS